MLLLLVFQLAVPNLTLTPGVARGLDQATVCATKWGKDARHVTEAMKREVARRYGIKRSSIKASGAGPCCEFDHLIRREQAGAAKSRRRMSVGSGAGVRVDPSLPNRGSL